MTDVFDRGSSLLFEIDFKKRSPHASLEYTNTTSATISVYNPSSSVVVSMQVCSATNANSTGLYHAIIQTSTGWVKGYYETKIMAYDSTGTYSDIDVEPRIFELE